MKISMIVIPVSLLIFLLIVIMNPVEPLVLRKSCSGLPLSLTPTRDLTHEMLESFGNITPERRTQLESLFDLGFMSSKYNGFYDMNGTWVVLNRINETQYRIWAGRDWHIGTDDQLHSPTCFVIVSEEYEPLFDNLEKLWYPYHCTYEEFLEISSNPHCLN